jgi:metal-dependent amidase/aminoacylase/carboxypeptidase family protein
MKKIAGKKLFSLPELIAFRKDMHQHAETGFKEFQTQSKIITYLEKIGVDKKSIQKCAKTGLFYDFFEYISAF